MKSMLPVDNGNTLAALQGLLRMLLENGIVTALLVPMRTSGGSVTPALVSDPDLLAAADPLAPVMPSNAATLAGKLSIREPRAKIGVVLRSCELRALVELVKLQQASQDDLVHIAVDCAATYSVPVFQQKSASAADGLWQPLFHTAAESPDSQDPDLRLACRICEQPIYENADISIDLIGSDLERAIQLSIREDLAETLDLPTGGTNDRSETLQNLVAARIAARDSELAAMRERLERDEGVVRVLDACIRCHNCMTVCPVCYCKTCVFKSPVFDHDPIKYVSWANQKGACRLPADTSLFHLTRLNHMGLSCVGCGMCTQACPADLPVGLVFRAIGQRLQETFAYRPGRDSDEPLPLITFEENEWTELGES